MHITAVGGFIWESDGVLEETSNLPLFFLIFEFALQDRVIPSSLVQCESKLCAVKEEGEFESLVKPCPGKARAEDFLFHSWALTCPDSLGSTRTTEKK